MKQFSINQLEQLSDIKAHTIRIWEQRYQLLSPLRTMGNTRFYMLADLQKLLNITFLLNRGMRISKIALLSKHELERQVYGYTSLEDRYTIAIHNLLFYKYASEIEKFDDVLDSCVHQWEIDVTLEKVILPFLEKASLLAYPDRNCETHFAVTAIRRKIILGIEKAQSEAGNNQNALLFLPEGEHYDLVLLYMAYTLKRKGIRVLYLGTNVPLENLKQVITEKNLKQLYTFIPYKHQFKLLDFIPFLQQQTISSQLTVATCDASCLKYDLKNVKFVSYKDFASVQQQ